MTIDKTGKYWRGTEAADIDEHVTAFEAGGYPIARVVHSRCSGCGGTAFGLWVDDTEGYADRRCIACGQVTRLLDSDDVGDDAEPEECACPCGGEAFELAVGYALRDGGDVRWVTARTADPSVSTRTGRSITAQRTTCMTARSGLR